ncbi:MAG: hypothetical protein ACK4NP_07075 [Parvularculaceae bacterium]
MSMLRFGAAAAGALLLAGCFVSDAPMFDASAASAAPLQPGLYDACSVPPENDGEDCQKIDVVWRKDGSYQFQIADENPIIARFHEIDGTSYAAQFEDDDGDGYQYYWARREPQGLLLAMIWCDDLPVAMRDTMKADGLIENEKGDSTCTVLKREAVIMAAQAYTEGSVAGDSAVRLTRAQ